MKLVAVVFFLVVLLSNWTEKWYVLVAIGIGLLIYSYELIVGTLKFSLKDILLEPQAQGFNVTRGKAPSYFLPYYSIAKVEHGLFPETWVCYVKGM